MAKKLLFETCSVGHARTGDKRCLMCYTGKTRCSKIDYIAKGFFGDDCFDPANFPQPATDPLTSNEIEQVRVLLRRELSRFQRGH